MQPEVREMEPYLPTPPLYRFVVSDERLDKVLVAIDKAVKGLTREQAVDVLFEIGYGDAVDLNSANPFEVLTPLQLCAAASALMVAAESRGRQEVSPRPEKTQ